MNKIAQDRNESDVLIKELDQLRTENLQVEDEQVKVIELIAVTERDVMQASNELADLRN